LIVFVLAASGGAAAGGAGDPLDEARALLAAGELAAAEHKLTKLIANSPERGAARLVLGLVHYRQERYQEALADFAAARACASPALPGPTSFNEGAVWFATGHYDKARAAFEETIRVAPDLAFLATVNAGEAALAEGDISGAGKHVAEATKMASTTERRGVVHDLATRVESEAHATSVKRRETLRARAHKALASDQPEKAAEIYRQLLADTDQPPLSKPERNLFEHGLGLALLRQKNYADAIAHFAQAAALDENDGDSLFMAGVANDRMGEQRRAVVLLRQAAAKDVDAETRKSIRSYLDRLAFGGRRGGKGSSVGVSVAVGYDSNVIQGMESRPETIAADQVGSPGALLTSASASLGYQWLVRETGLLAIEYSLDQVVYPDRDHADLSLQDHNLRLKLEWSPRFNLRFGLGLAEELQFTGLGNFRPFQNVVGAEPFVAFDELPSTSTSVGILVQGKKALDPEYAYFSGSRLDLLLRQRVRWGNVHGDVAFRRRWERIGIRSAPLLSVGDAQTFQFRKPKPTDPPDQATYVYIAPYSYDSNAVLASLEVSKGIWRFGADGSAEILRFKGDSLVRFVAPNLGIDRLSQRQHRDDLRLAGSLSVTATVHAPLSLVLRYDVVDNRSTLVLDVDNRNYIKHVITLTAEADW
jgi:tetratricopeptide (TPR) repeat protein